MKKKPVEKEKAILEGITEDDLAGKSGTLGGSIIEETTPVTSIVEVRRSNRVSRPPQRFSPSANYLLLTDEGEPLCYHEALQMDDAAQWELAMQEEMNSLEKNQTWCLTNLPVGKRALQNKWCSGLRKNMIAVRDTRQG